MYLCPGHNAPSADEVVGVAGEQSLAVSGPGQADTLRLAALLADRGGFGLKFIDLALLLEVENDDAAGSGGAEPVAVGREDESVDLVVGAEGVQMLGLVKVPKHGGTVLAARSAEGAVGGDGDGVNVAGVANVVGLELAGGELPNLGRCQIPFHPQPWIMCGRHHGIEARGRIRAIGEYLSHGLAALK